MRRPRRWLRLQPWLIPGLAMALAVVAAVFAGQPPAADSASGRSVAVQMAAISPEDAQPALVYVTNGTVFCMDQVAGTTATLRLPPGIRARSALVIGDNVLILTHTDNAFLWRGQHLIDLGGAQEAVHTAGRTGAWLVRNGLARRIDSGGRVRPGRIKVPAGARLVGAVGQGLIATSGSALVPGETMLLRPGSPEPVVIAYGQALSVARGKVLIGRGSRLSVLTVADGTEHRIPGLAAVIATGQGKLSPDASAFAVTARTGGLRRLIVGSTSATNARALRVLPLDDPGSTAHGGLPAPSWTSSDLVVAVRSDGRLIEYHPGATEGVLPRNGPTSVGGLAAGEFSPTATCPGRTQVEYDPAVRGATGQPG